MTMSLLQPHVYTREETGDLSTHDAVTLLRAHGVQHIVWLTPGLDRNLAAYAGNFGITFQHFSNGAISPIGLNVLKEIVTNRPSILLVGERVVCASLAANICEPS